jgi:endonuclease/exonuclease/phosphatase family metal-dependent hydrolase
LQKIVSPRVGLFLLIFLSASILSWADFQDLSQQPQESQARLKILTLNVMQSASEPRASRFQRIVNFLVNEPVHLLALQELSGGQVDTPPTQDSGADLANMLAAAGLQYGYYTEANWGYPPFLVFKVGVLPRYRMPIIAATSIGAPTDSGLFPERKNVVMCGVDIPGFGRVNLYSVHVYNPSAEGVETQIDNLMQFVKARNAQNPAMACVVAGDMNFSVDSSPAAYQKFLDQGFTDAYAELHDPANPQKCCTIANTAGCTFGVPGNPIGSAASPSRIDFLFVKGNGLRVTQSRVIFNGTSEDFVSDHCAVLTEIVRRHLPVPMVELLLD